MKTYFRFLKLFLFLFFVHISCGLLSQSILWKISGKKIKDPSYLFGTIHITDERVFAFDSTVYHAMYACDAIALEMVMDKIDREEMEKNMLMKSGTLKDFYSEEEWKTLETAFREKTGSSILLFQRMKPFFVYSQLMQGSMKKDRPEALDMYLLKIFRDAGKPVLGIEQLSDQLKAIDQITLKEQAKMLLMGMTDTAKTEDSGSQYDEIIDLYITQNIEEMLGLMADTAMPEKFNQAFLIDRNVKMTKNIIKFSQKQSTFNAVGAAHLPGEKGIIALLRKKGYTVEPVEIKFRDIISR